MRFRGRICWQCSLSRLGLGRGGEIAADPTQHDRPYLARRIFKWGKPRWGRHTDGNRLYSNLPSCIILRCNEEESFTCHERRS